MGVLLCFRRKCSAANKHHSSEEGVRGRLLLLGIVKVTNAHRERIGSVVTSQTSVSTALIPELPPKDNAAQVKDKGSTGQH